MVLGLLNVVRMPRLLISSKNGRTTTGYVAKSTFELMSGPRTRINLVSGAVFDMDMYGFTTTVGGLVVRLTLFDAYKSKFSARRSALLVAKVGSNVNRLLGSKVIGIATV